MSFLDTHYVIDKYSNYNLCHDTDDDSFIDTNPPAPPHPYCKDTSFFSPSNFTNSTCSSNTCNSNVAINNNTPIDDFSILTNDIKNNYDDIDNFTTYNNNICQNDMPIKNIFLFGKKNSYTVAYNIMATLNIENVTCLNVAITSTLKKNFKNMNLFIDCNNSKNSAILYYGNITSEFLTYKLYAETYNIPIFFINSYNATDHYEFSRDCVIFSDIKNTCMLKSVYNFILTKNTMQHLTKFKNMLKMTEKISYKDGHNVLLIINNIFYSINFDNSDIVFDKFINNDLESNIQNRKNTYNEVNMHTMLFKPCSVFGIIGRRDTGKSTIVSNLLKHFENNNAIDECIIICPSDNYSKFYEKLTHDLNYKLYYELDLDIIDAFICNNNNKNKTIVLDDVFYDKLSFKNVFNNLFYKSKQINVNFIFTFQYPSGLTSELRNNIDYLFVSYDACLSNIKRIYDNYFNMFPTFSSFNNTLYLLTKNNWSFMMLDNTTKLSNINDKIKKYITHDNIQLTKKLNNINYLEKNNKITLKNDIEQILKNIIIITNQLDNLKKKL